MRVAPASPAGHSSAAEARKPAPSASIPLLPARVTLGAAAWHGGDEADEVDGEEEAELQGATESALTFGLGSCGDGIVLDAMGDREREETGGAMALLLRVLPGWLAGWLGFIPELWLQCKGAQARIDRYNDADEFVARESSVARVSECVWADSKKKRCLGQADGAEIYTTWSAARV